MKLLLLLAACCVLNTKANVIPETKIIGGQISTELVPSHVHLRILFHENWFAGSGALIDWNLVLTVAQNVHGFNQFRAGVGSQNFMELNWMDVDGVWIHPDYNPNTLINNIAMIRLTANVSTPALPVPFTDNISFPSQPWTGTGIIAGFGFYDQSHNFLSGKLRQSTKSVTTESECQSVHNQLLMDNPGQFFCAQNPLGENFCGGDQGAGLIINNILAGLASTVLMDNNCMAQFPALYMRVSWYANLLYLTISQNAFDPVTPIPTNL